MNYQDAYVLNMSINDTKVDIEPQNYSFSTTENINSLYCKASISFYDGTGLLQEFLGTTLGTLIELGFGDKDTINTSKFRINYDALDQPDQPGFLTGDVDMFLLHTMFFEQEIISKAYEDRISGIVKDLTDKYNFSSTDIDDTGNENIWYQPLITDAKFIQERLLPYAYSYNASKTPFYSYITSDNVYHFRNIQSMLDKGNVATIDYKVISGDSDEDKSLKNKTSSLKRWRNSYKNIWKIQNRVLYSIDRATGELSESEDDITMYPAENNLKMPIVNESSDLTTSWHDDVTTEDETGAKENILGLQASSMKDGMFIDEFLLLQPFNPEIHAGNTIQLNIYVMNENGTKLSTNFSGKYIVIECEHIWDGENSRAHTKLIVGRKYISVANSFLVKGKLL